MNGIRQGRCEYADYEGDKHTVVWTVGIDMTGYMPKKERIKKTDIWMLKAYLDGELFVSFEHGKWNKRAPIFNWAARDAYRMIVTLYSWFGRGCDDPK